MPPFREDDFRDPALERFVEDVLLEAAAARLVEPAVLLVEDFVPDFVPPRADEDDRFDAPVERPVFEADLVPPRADFEELFVAFVEVREVFLAALFFAPPLVVDFDAVFLAPPFAEDFDALFFAPLLAEDFDAVFFAPPLFADERVAFLAPEDELLVPLLLVDVEVAEPPEEPAELG